VAAARSGVATSRAALERARLDVERTEIRAPFTGVIAELRLSPGQQLQVNQAICRLVDNADVEAEVGVLESDLAGIELGRPALLAIPALADTLPVTVDVISPEVDRESRTCRVLMRLADRRGRVRPGMFVRAAIAGRILDDRLVVPREALLTREGRPLVFKIEDDQAKWLYVALGERNERLVEITRVEQGGTLEAGDPVIVSNHLTLAHNAKVKVRRTIEVENPWTPAAP
jgi:RND family efflux transporter MFP subunit